MSVKYEAAAHGQRNLGSTSRSEVGSVEVGLPYHSFTNLKEIGCPYFR
jgi:hypothetical protein